MNSFVDSRRGTALLQLEEEEGMRMKEGHKWGSVEKTKNYRIATQYLMLNLDMGSSSISTGHQEYISHTFVLGFLSEATQRPVLLPGT